MFLPPCFPLGKETASHRSLLTLGRENPHIRVHLREHPYKMPALEVGGGHDVVREIARMLKYKSVPNSDKAGGSKKSKNFADVVNGCSLIALHFDPRLKVRIC